MQMGADAFDIATWIQTGNHPGEIQRKLRLEKRDERWNVNIFQHTSQMPSDDGIWWLGDRKSIRQILESVLRMKHLSSILRMKPSSYVVSFGELRWRKVPNIEISFSCWNGWVSDHIVFKRVSRGFQTQQERTHIDRYTHTHMWLRLKQYVPMDPHATSQVWLLRSIDAISHHVSSSKNRACANLASSPWER